MNRYSQISMGDAGLPILLVEDTSADAILLHQAFKRLEISNPVHHVRDGQQALEYLYSLSDDAGEESASIPALIIMDIKLPKVDGLSVLQELKQHQSLKKIPVVMLTTSSQIRDINDAYEYGVNGYLVKPVKFSDFVDIIAGIKEYWLKKNTYPSLV